MKYGKRARVAGLKGRSDRQLALQRGQSVVELTFGFLLFFVIFSSVVEFSHLLYTKLTLQHSFREAGRYMITGRTKKDTSQENISRPEVIRNVFCANLISTGLRCPEADEFTFTCFKDDGSKVSCSEPGGGPEQTVNLAATFKKRALFPFFVKVFPEGGVDFQLSTTWKNEPFSRN